MRVLLDTNILIYREAATVTNQDIGHLFKWLDNLKIEKWIHPQSIAKVQKHADSRVVASFQIKLESYNVLKVLAPTSTKVQEIQTRFDKNQNDVIDTQLLNEVYCERVDMLISEDKKIHLKANALGISKKVMRIEQFLQQCVAENPQLVDYIVLAVKKELFGNINLSDSFFDSLCADYVDFDKWFNKKAQEYAYICTGGQNEILAFLYIKVEHNDEVYRDIQPMFVPKKRLKVGTLKVVSAGYKLGERFLKIVFDNAIVNQVEEIYVTIFDRTEEQQKLISLLEIWGFVLHGSKNNGELVYCRDFSPIFNMEDPRLTFPYISRNTPKHIVAIYPKYHTELFPDSILRTESPANFVESRPNRNALSKVYISRSIKRDIARGDVIVFYRTASNGFAEYTSVTTTIGVVQDVYLNIRSLQEFQSLCQRRSVFTDIELAEHWNYRSNSRPFVVNFLYMLSLPKRLNRHQLIELGIIDRQTNLRGFEPLSHAAFLTLMEHSNANMRLIVN